MGKQSKMGQCAVCISTDPRDPSTKYVEFCDCCGEWICPPCQSNVGRRLEAFAKKKGKNPFAYLKSITECLSRKMK